jgi:hypothetical protein
MYAARGEKCFSLHYPLRISNVGARYMQRRKREEL